MVLPSELSQTDLGRQNLLDDDAACMCTYFWQVKRLTHTQRPLFAGIYSLKILVLP